MLFEPWRITLLGALTARNNSFTITRFRTRQSGMLLACLAYFPDRPQSREELADRLWPEADPEASRASLRVALSSLRHQLEPPGIEAGCVLMADRSSVRLRPEVFTTDIAEFQAALRPPTGAESPAARAHRLTRAVAAYHGELLPGMYEEWVLEAREALAAQYRRVLGTLLETQEQLGNDEAVQECADRLIAADPLEETGYLALMRLALKCGDPAQTLREFERLETRLRNDLGEPPSDEAHRLADTARACPNTGRGKREATADSPVEEAVSLAATPILRRTLPLSWTRFFGREAEIETLAKWVGGETRLTTVTGPGGAGKTRLATEAARRLADNFPGLICFVPLADILSAPLIPDAIAAGLRLSSASKASIGDASPLDQITEALAGAPALLILDNLEQIAEEAAPFIQNLLTRLPLLRCLVTSRRSLHLPGERVLPLPPLPTPLHAGTPEGLLAYAGVQLFVDRAQAVRPDFQITPRNADAVGALCDRLEGLPLALELAAAWIGALTPAQALTRLDARFALLVSRTPDTVKRHRTMHAAIAWSFDLLPADLRDFWLHLSVFRGGWTLEAAEAVCEQPNALEALERLRERSLILAEETADGARMRYRMLESLREFACDQRAESDTLDDAGMQSRHARFFLNFVEVKQLEMTGAGAKACLDRVEAERANIAAALEWYDRPEQDPEMGLRVAGALWRFWSLRGSLTEGQFWLERTRARASETSAGTDMEARAWNGLAVLVRIQGDPAKAIEFNECALEVWRLLGDARGTAASLNNIGSARMLLGELEAAQPLLEESVSLWRSLDKPLNVAGSLQNLAYLAFLRGDLEAADRFCLESLMLFESGGDQNGTAQVKNIQAGAAIKRGDLQLALHLGTESLQSTVRLGYLPGAVNCFDVLSEVACAGGDAQRSALLLGAVERLMGEIGARRDRPEEIRVEGILKALRSGLGEEGLTEALSQGHALTLDQAVALGCSENPQSVQ